MSCRFKYTKTEYSKYIKSPVRCTRTNIVDNKKKSCVLTTFYLTLNCTSCASSFKFSITAVFEIILLSHGQLVNWITRLPLLYFCGFWEYRNLNWCPHFLPTTTRTYTTIFWPSNKTQINWHLLELSNVSLYFDRPKNVKWF